MLERSSYLARIESGLSRSPIVALLGPRQCGKTTLAKMVSELHPVSHFFDLESLQDSQRLINAEKVLGSLSGLVILDEIQLKPELFSTLRVLVDDVACEARFVILGSASPELIKHASESLAGRVEFVDLHGFDVSEVGVDEADALWCRGGFPRSFLSKSDEDSSMWREGFVRTFLERDLPQLGIRIPSHAMRRFWTMLAHSHGQTWNASKLGASMGLSDKTVRSYLDILSGTYMVRQLQPWFENVKKRQVKMPKVYLRDSGILHHLMTIDTMDTLQSHPMLGASWEGFAIEQILRTGLFNEAYFWAVHSGAELDLLTFRHGKKIGFEFKASTTPGVTKSMKQATELLDLSHLYIVCPTNHTYPIHEKMTVCAPWHVPEHFQPSS
jgi:predicted AAA+ superfamily ATPase